MYYPETMKFINADTGWVGGKALSNKMGLVARTVDGGKSWRVSEVPGTLEIQSLDFVDGSIGWAVGFDIHKTVDGGRTWTRESVDPPVFTRVYNLDRQHGWAGGVNSTFFRRPALPAP